MKLETKLTKRRWQLNLESVVRIAQAMANRLNKPIYIYFDEQVGAYAIEFDEAFATKALEVCHPYQEKKQW